MQPGMLLPFPTDHSNAQMGAEVSSRMVRRWERQFLPAPPLVLGCASGCAAVDVKARQETAQLCREGSLLAGESVLAHNAEVLALHLLFGKDFVTAQCDSSSPLTLLAGFLHS